MSDEIDPWVVVDGEVDISTQPEIFENDVVCRKKLVAEGDINAKGKIVARENIIAQKNIYVSQDVFFKSADCAEEFGVVSKSVEPGTVVVLRDRDLVTSSYREYDKRVAGVISGAGQYKPGIILDKKESTENNVRMPVALMGKVYCKVDADYSPIEIGDLLTTSNTEGHAMKSVDPLKSFGSVIGKALSSAEKGKH